MTVPLEDRYVGPCTLNGKPATVSGRRNAFATVATLEGIERAEWAWETVARIMAKDGNFHA